MLQETHCTKKYRQIWCSQFRKDIYFADGESNARGVAIAFNKDLGVEVKEIS